MSKGRDGRRRRRRLPKRGESASPAAAPDSWVALARRFVRGEGGTVHITHPAMELLERYGYDASAAIYGHFKRGGAEKGARSYLRVGGSSREKRVAVEYVPEHDAVFIWRWGEAEHDPDLSVQTCSQTLRSMAVATMRGIGDVLARVLRVAPRPR